MDEPVLIQKVVAKGGFKVHLKPKGSDTALCGHTPHHTSARSMKRRAGWMLFINQEATKVTCTGCLDKAKEN